MQIVGGRAAGAAIYPEKLCVAICKGLANQKRKLKTRTVQTLPMTAGRLSSLSMLCREATGSIALSGVEHTESRPAGVTSPKGDWPSH